MLFQKGRAKTGGKKKGTLNRATERRMRLLDGAEEALIKLGQNPATVSPLMVMCSVMCLRLQERDYKTAVEVAALAAPYVHARLNAAEVRVQHSIAQRSDEEVAIEIEMLRAKIARSKDLPPPEIEGAAQTVEERAQDIPVVSE